jgi:transcriptional regulator with XRE-family HTH domain
MSEKDFTLDVGPQELARRMGVPLADIRRNEAVLDFAEAVAASIRKARQARGWSQKELARRLGVTAGRISQYETGDLRHAPSLKTIAEIGYLLGAQLQVPFGVSAREVHVRNRHGKLRVGVARALAVSVDEARALPAQELGNLLSEAVAVLGKEHPELASAPLLSDAVRAELKDG